MRTETYKGRRLKVVAGRGRDFGSVRSYVNGEEQYRHMGDEDGALRSLRGTIDHADEVGVESGRYGAHWYAPGTFEMCPEGHPRPIGGECGHDWCVEQRRPAGEGEGFYVTARDGSKFDFLLGPYGTHAEADANVDRARRYVLDRAPLASFWGYGTAKLTRKPGRTLRPGKLNGRIGLVAGETEGP